jgi:hypothetical protein
MYNKNVLSRENRKIVHDKVVLTSRFFFMGFEVEFF